MLATSWSANVDEPFANGIGVFASRWSTCVLCSAYPFVMDSLARRLLVHRGPSWPSHGRQLTVDWRERTEGMGASGVCGSDGNWANRWARAMWLTWFRGLGMGWARALAIPIRSLLAAQPMVIGIGYEGEPATPRVPMLPCAIGPDGDKPAAGNGSPEGAVARRLSPARQCFLHPFPLELLFHARTILRDSDPEYPLRYRRYAPRHYLNARCGRRLSDRSARCA